MPAGQVHWALVFALQHRCHRRLSRSLSAHQPERMQRNISISNVVQAFKEKAAEKSARREKQTEGMLLQQDCS